ncbi:SPOR domain-containing protein [Novosphingobium rosa]|uniref:SPOR domain-containing protein n=1 Tax=Novosphingobium rosa TaxID=76978 RepID=UPI000830B437|nr:SPOR domain-containing protein [Novosphingobium rosa]
MSGENQGNPPQNEPWLNDAREALAKKAGEQGQEWVANAQDQVHQGQEWAGNAAHDAGQTAENWIDQSWDKHSWPTPGTEPVAALNGNYAGTEETLNLQDRDRLPWLDNAGDDEDYYAVDHRRVIAAVVGGLLLLAVVVGGVFAFTHRKDGAAPVADGSVIGASDQPYKQAPANPGGKQFEGTGDSSFAAAQGKDHPAQLAAGDSAPKPAAPVDARVDSPKTDAKPEAKPSAAAASAASAEDAGPVGGVVQIAAYSNEGQARSGWDHLVQQHEMLKGMNHRIVQGQSDIGTVFRLQLLASAGGGSALCSKLKAEGIPCQVKH